jgi:hypothetical protein
VERVVGKEVVHGAAYFTPTKVVVPAGGELEQDPD